MTPQRTREVRQRTPGHPQHPALVTIQNNLPARRREQDPAAITVPAAVFGHCALVHTVETRAVAGRLWRGLRARPGCGDLPHQLVQIDPPATGALDGITGY